MMLDADKMVAAASSRNPTLAGALTRLQRCAFSGSWEVYHYILLVIYFDLIFIVFNWKFVIGVISVTCLSVYVVWIHRSELLQFKLLLR